MEMINRVVLSMVDTYSEKQICSKEQKANESEKSKRKIKTVVLLELIGLEGGYGLGSRF
jgi:hypothetical protein